MLNFIANSKRRNVCHEKPQKVLALALALVMSLSLVTIANAADFSNDADIDYSEAVAVMSTIGVIDGVGNNSFDPNR